MPPAKKSKSQKQRGQKQKGQKQQSQKQQGKKKKDCGCKKKGLFDFLLPASWKIYYSDKKKHIPPHTLTYQMAKSMVAGSQGAKERGKKAAATRHRTHLQKVRAGKAGAAARKKSHAAHVRAGKKGAAARKA